MDKGDIQTILITGSGGLIGSEAVKFFAEIGYSVVGIDNNMRQKFFGSKGDTSSNIISLLEDYHNFQNYSMDIRDKKSIEKIMVDLNPEIVIHTAAQPSHDWAAKSSENIYTDFEVNAVGTLNLLEAFRTKISNSEKVFIHMSTNKVYGDNPNEIPIKELEKRWEYDLEGMFSKRPELKIGVSEKGINEFLSLDNCTHSFFGVSKATGDLLAQEYGKNFGINVGIFRGGCLTGPQHSAVELHGFLTYIVDCAVNKQEYNIFGYKGKQVRDQIHSEDVISAFWEFIQDPKKGEAYNLSGCKENSASILEVIDILKKDFGIELNYQYKEQNRVGDHICYYSDMSKFKKDYPNWKITKGLNQIIEEIILAKGR